MAGTPHLEFERDIVEVQDKIEHLLDLAEKKGIDVSAELFPYDAAKNNYSTPVQSLSVSEAH